jgi:hypothetical protein
MKTMKINITTIVTVIISLMLFQSCKKVSTNGDIDIVYFADLQLNGDQVMVITLGDTYDEPGYIALEQGEDISSKVKVGGNVNANSSGAYTLTYSVSNSDGYSKSLQRLVLVVPEGLSPVDFSGTYAGQRVVRADNAAATVIESVGGGAFYATDFFGGFYNYVAGYGPTYQLGTYFYVSGNNEVKALSTASPWGPWDVLNGVYDSATKVFTYEVSQPDLTFGVKLTKE